MERIVTSQKKKKFSTSVVNLVCFIKLENSHLLLIQCTMVLQKLKVVNFFYKYTAPCALSISTESETKNASSWKEIRDGEARRLGVRWFTFTLNLVNFGQLNG